MNIGCWSTAFCPASKKSNMFDLEQAIADWRKQMLAAGIQSPVPLEELESHLRDDVEDQIQSGLNGRQAFKVAVERIGQAVALESEFAKVGGTPDAGRWKFVRIGGYAPAVFMALVGTRYFLSGEISLGEQMLGLSAVVFIASYLCSLPYFFRFLLTVQNKRAKIVIKIASTFAWLSCGALILANLTVNQIAVALWAMIPVVAVLVWIPCIADYNAGTPPPSGGSFQPIPPGPIPGPRPFKPELGEPVQPFKRRLPSPQLIPL
jgi:hypothetical protein